MDFGDSQNFEKKTDVDLVYTIEGVLSTYTPGIIFDLLVSVLREMYLLP